MANSIFRPTPDLYGGFQDVFEIYNDRLFEGRLSNALITLEKRKNSYGHFVSALFQHSTGHSSDKISLNPSYFSSRSVEETLSTLVHEMVHQFQHQHGEPGRSGYHNKEWAKLIKHIGLQPTDTGEPGGKETGDKMSHYVLEGGLFDLTTKHVLNSGFTIEWAEKLYDSNALRLKNNAEGQAQAVSARNGRRSKYSCPCCGLNVWAKHDAEESCERLRAFTRV